MFLASHGLLHGRSQERVCMDEIYTYNLREESLRFHTKCVRLSRKHNITKGQ